MGLAYNSTVPYLVLCAEYGYLMEKWKMPGISQAAGGGVLQYVCSVTKNAGGACVAGCGDCEDATGRLVTTLITAGFAFRCVCVDASQVVRTGTYS